MKRITTIGLATLIALVFTACNSHTRGPSFSSKNDSLGFLEITPKPLVIDGNTYENYTLWECRDWMDRSDNIIELVNIHVKHDEFKIDTNETNPKKLKELRESEKGIDKALKNLINMFNNYVLFDNRSEHTQAFYYRHGLDHRWDWGGESSKDETKFSFIINPNGQGLYYDFSNVPKGETTSARGIFKCKKTQIAK